MASAIALSEAQLMQLGLFLFVLGAGGSFFGYLVWTIVSTVMDRLAAYTWKRFIASERGQKFVEELRLRRAAKHGGEVL